MRIRTSRVAGSVPFSLTETPPTRVVDGGETLIVFSLTNARLGGARAELMLRPDEIDRLYEERKKLGK